MRTGILACMLLVGCSTISTTYDFDPKADFSGLRSYSWRQPVTEAGDDKVEETNPLVVQRVKRALDTQLAANGFTRRERGGDFEIVFYLRSRERTEVRQSYGAGYGYRYGGWGGTVDVYQYEEGSLIVDVINPKTSDAIWRGVARSALPRNPTPEQTDKLINEAVEKILQNFPPPPRKS
ncbi:MAG: DUF4136 domain-containing protein [Planctomycetota bacterium]